MPLEGKFEKNIGYVVGTKLNYFPDEFRSIIGWNCYHFLQNTLAPTPVVMQSFPNNFFFNHDVERARWADY